METFLRILGDGLTITALSIICAVSRIAWKRIPPGVSVPMQWGRDGRPSLRASRTVALLFTPILASVLLLGISAFGLTRLYMDPIGAVMVFGIRSTLGAFLALMHLFHLRWAMKTLIEDGDIPD
jgi:hypothetical protein